jgi:proteasome lid subunit RPN8/RPN11
MKMQLLLTHEVMKRFQREMRRARSREIGGLLMGEHVADEVFRAVDVSVQRLGGSHVGFIRNPKEHEAQLQTFFARTGNDYTRFNYLGEWHSHPSFEPYPSPMDIETMQSIVEDSAVGVNFLVLLICRLGIGNQIELTATAFRPGTQPLAVPIVPEFGPKRRSLTLLQQLCRILGR